MSKTIEEFLVENENLYGQLIDIFERIEAKYSVNSFPNEQERAEATELLKQYRNALIHFHPEIEPEFRYGKKNKNLPFRELSVIREMSEKKHIELLLRLTRERMLSADDCDFATEEGADLLEQGYCDEIVTKQDQKRYYIPSAKAEQVLRNRRVSANIRKSVVSAIIPEKMLCGNCEWSELRFKRTALLEKYYHKNKYVNYMLFSLDESQDLIFGCLVSNSIEIEYSFAAVFDEKVDEQIVRLKEIINSNEIDRVIIVVESVDIIDMLREKGISEDNYRIMMELLL